MKPKKKPTIAMQLPGALALAAAGAATQANAATIQITFANNYVSSSTGLTNLVADLTGDGFNDVFGSVRNASYAGVISSLAGVGLAIAFSNSSGSFVRIGAGSLQHAAVAVRALASVQFRDIQINGGALTMGWADVTATAAAGAHRVQINRLIFDDASTTAPTGITTSTSGLSEWSANAVPEPSSLGLLALGAGGLLARRRRSMAA